MGHVHAWMQFVGVALMGINVHALHVPQLHPPLEILHMPGVHCAITGTGQVQTIGAPHNVL